MTPNGRAKAIAEDGTVWIADIYEQPNLLQVSAWHWPSSGVTETELGGASLVVCRDEPWVGPYDLKPYWATANFNEGEMYTKYEWGKQKEFS